MHRCCQFHLPYWPQPSLKCRAGLCRAKLPVNYHLLQLCIPTFPTLPVHFICPPGVKRNTQSLKEHVTYSSTYLKKLVIGDWPLGHPALSLGHEERVCSLILAPNHNKVSCIHCWQLNGASEEKKECEYVLNGAAQAHFNIYKADTLTISLTTT